MFLFEKFSSDFYLVTFQLHQENRKKGKKREKSVDEDDEEVKRDKLNKVYYG